jgi:peptide/nickel transport system substrate-binding protein
MISITRRGTGAAGFVAFALLGALAMASCSSSSNKTTNQTDTTTAPVAHTLFSPAEMNQPQQTGTPVEGGSMTFGLEANVATLTPGNIQQPSDWTVADAVYDPIVGFDSKGLPAPVRLASKWSNSADLKSWTFTLRPGISFSDGTPVNAAAVVTQFNGLKALPGCGCAADVAHITKIEAVSDLVVQFTLDQANVAFPGFLAGQAGYLAAPSAWAAGAATMTNHPVGSGPFKQLTPGKFVFVRNPSYWRKTSTGQKLPYLDKMTYVPLADSTARIPAVKGGTVDIFQTADTINLVQAHKDPSLVVQPISGSSSTIIVLNSHKAPFDDIRLRQAYNYAMPRNDLNTGYYGNSRQPAYGPLDPSNPYFDKNGQLPTQDAAKAKALVAAVAADHKPTSFVGTCISTPEASAVYAIINKADIAAGMKSTLQTVDQVALVNKLLARDGNFENACFRNSQVADPDGLYSTYYRTAGQNVSMTNDLTIDAALRQGRKSTDFATRKAAYDIVQEQLAKDVTVVPMLFDLYGNVHTKGVSGLSRPQPNSLGLIDQASLYLVQGS